MPRRALNTVRCRPIPVRHASMKAACASRSRVVKGCGPARGHQAGQPVVEDVERLDELVAQSRVDGRQQVVDLLGDLKLPRRGEAVTAGHDQVGEDRQGREGPRGQRLERPGRLDVLARQQRDSHRRRPPPP